MKKHVNKIVIFLVIVLIGFTVNAADCNSVLGSELSETLKENVYKPVKILAPILFLILTTVDFAKAIFAGDDKEGIEKAKKNFGKRAVAVLVVFFAPNILHLIFGLVSGDTSVENLRNCIDIWG